MTSGTLCIYVMVGPRPDYQRLAFVANLFTSTMLYPALMDGTWDSATTRYGTCLRKYWKILNVCLELALKPLEGEELSSSANSTENARGDIQAGGFLGSEQAWPCIFWCEGILPPCTFPLPPLVAADLSVPGDGEAPAISRKKFERRRRNIYRFFFFFCVGRFPGAWLGRCGGHFYVCGGGGDLGVLPRNFYVFFLPVYILQGWPDS